MTEVSKGCGDRTVRFSGRMLWSLPGFLTSKSRMWPKVRVSHCDGNIAAWTPQ